MRRRLTEPVSQQRGAASSARNKMALEKKVLAQDKMVLWPADRILAVGRTGRPG
jgi:hypothetical protein